MEDRNTSKSAVIAAAFAILLLLAGNLPAQTWQKQNQKGPKSRTTALGLSLGTTLVPLAIGFIMHSGENKDSDDHFSDGESLMLAGLMIGPGIGHAYADNQKRLTTGCLIRGGGVLLVALGQLRRSDLCFLGEDCPEPDHDGDISPLTIIGLTLCTASAILDIATVGDSVDKYNRKHRRFGVMVSPTWFASQEAAGVTVSITF